GRIINDAPSLLSRKLDNRSGVQVVFGAVHAGAVQNVIPDSGYVAGTIRVLDSVVWEQAPEAFERVVREIAAPTGVEATVDYQRGVPPVDNAEHAISMLSSAAAKTLGPGAVVTTQQSMGGEDFSWYLREVPGAMAASVSDA
ncbi:MAG: M20/M25/M40 family metallo-hydrolase, partial [Pseudonocardiaceae bacterium]